MLVLTRKNREVVIISDNIKITVLAINGNQVKLGIEAPREVAVHRKEIHDRILAETLAEEATISSRTYPTENIIVVN